jgi:superfamily I DNA/RNA helicase
MGIIPSEDQINVFNFLRYDQGNAVVSAVAGSGKTTTLLEALKYIPDDKTVIFLAFNKSIADELKNRVPKKDNIHVRTVHSYGYTILKREYPDMEINPNKYRELFRNIIKFHQTKDLRNLSKYKFDKRKMKYVNTIYSTMEKEGITNDNLTNFISDVIDLCNHGRLNYININNKLRSLKKLDQVSDIFAVNNEESQSLVAYYLLKLGTHYIGEIDYTDMLYLPNLFDIEPYTYDFVFIDECQDLSICQRLLMDLAKKPKSGRFIAVGDPTQAIYGFAGADNESFRELLKFPNTKQLPLSTSYRCHSQIVDTIKHINPDIKHHPGNENGQVIRDFSHNDVKNGDMILCRMTLPLVSLCIKYLKDGKRAQIMGSDIGLSLIKMIQSTERKTEDFVMDNVFRRLYKEMDKMISKIKENHMLSEEEARNDTHVTIFNEKIQAIEAISGNETDPNKVIDKINDIFSSKIEKGIMLSTIHKSKGLESDRVFILQPELLPSPKATADWEIEQEQNLIYVAHTRAKTLLGFITDFDAFKRHGDSSRRNLEPIKESEFVGHVGQKMLLDLKVVNIREVNGKYGFTNVYDMVDRNGNVFTKFGDISHIYLKSYDSFKVIEGSEVSFYGKITGHSEFRGTKSTKIGKISSH